MNKEQITNNLEYYLLCHCEQAIAQRGDPVYNDQVACDNKGYICTLHTEPCTLLLCASATATMPSATVVVMTATSVASPTFTMTHQKVWMI